MSTNEFAKLKAMKKCIPHLEDAPGQLLVLHEEIDAFLAQSKSIPSSTQRTKRKRDSTDPTTAPSKQRKLSQNSSTSSTTPLTVDDDDDDDDEVVFVEGPSKPIFSKYSRRASPPPVAGPSSLGKKTASAVPTEFTEWSSGWMAYLSYACDELEEAANGDGMQHAILGPKMRALAQTIYNNC